MSRQKYIKSEEQWKDQLTPEQYYVTRTGGTERPFTGKYCNCKDSGIYTCVCCGNNLFSSATKFDSGTGWPSFSAPIEEKKLKRKSDTTLGMQRTEVLCSQCDAHLGHVFSDGPRPLGMRYCVNSTSLQLVRESADGQS